MTRHMYRCTSADESTTLSAVEDPKTPIGLGARQFQIVQHVVTGATDQQIARTLGISKRTVSHTLSNVYNKTGVSNRTHLAGLYLRGLLVEDTRR